MDTLPRRRFVLVRRILAPLLVTSLTIVAALLLTRVLGPLPLAVTQTVTQKQSTFDITGKSEIQTVPNQATVRLGVTSTANTVATAQKQTNQTISSITDELDKLGIPKEDIKTSNYSIYPQYDYNNGSQRINGYQVNADLVVKILDFEKVNQAIDAATSHGANQVSGVEFDLTKEKREELTKQAREEAIKDAQQNAAELAKLSNLKLGRVVNVYELPQDMGMPMPYDMMSSRVMKEGTGNSEPTQIQPGSTTFNYQVTLSYETL